ncbi:MAG: dephospho-CoA kinase [Gracilimonas sp.]
MIKVGITGGIGSGKTTFCKEWEKLGAFVLYADDFAKQLMNDDEELKKKIITVFGKHAYDESGNLDRKYLAHEAFEKDRVEELNELVHPVLWERTESLAEEKKREGYKVFAKEAAVLLNKGRPEGFDHVIIILADETARVKRTKERDESTEKLVKDRITKQPDFDKLVHLADFVVTNDDTIKELKDKARIIYSEISEQLI